MKNIKNLILCPSYLYFRHFIFYCATVTVVLKSDGYVENQSMEKWKRFSECGTMKKLKNKFNRVRTEI